MMIYFVVTEANDKKSMKLSINNFMKVKQIIITGLLMIVFLSGNIFAQQNQPPTPGTSSKPLELPNFIIEGKEQVDVRSGIKQFPEKPLAMSQENLDSLNSLEKQQSLLLQPQPLPNKILNSDFNKGYVIASVGRYGFAKIEGGYEYNLKEYTFFGNGGFDYGGEHVKNSAYNKFKLNLFADYLAPDKYFIFGGSKTRFSMLAGNRNYKLYAVDKPMERNLFDLELGINSEGSYSNFVFSTGADFKTLQLNDKTTDSKEAVAFDNLLSGYIEIKNMDNNYELGGRAKADLESVRGNGVSYFEAGLFGKFDISKITINLEGGLQFGNNSNDVSRGGLLIRGEIDYKLNENYTIKASVFTGIRKVSYMEMMNINPYAQRGIDVDYLYDTPLIKGVIYYHPLKNIGASAGISIASSDRTPVFDTLHYDSFILSYERVNKLDVFSEGYYLLTSKDEISYFFSFDYSTLSGNGNIAPYNPLIRVSLNYQKKMMDDKLLAGGELRYIGKRYADFANEIELEGYVDLKLNASYKILSNFKVELVLDNLLNSDIYIWQGYKERGLFFGLKAYYQF